VVVDELTARGCAVRVLSRSPQPPRSGVEYVVGDLANGSGLHAAVRSVQAVIHCASRPVRARVVDVDGTRRLLAELASARPGAHLVYVSIVGCDANPLPYYRAKTECERLVLAAATPTSVLRATQFHELVRTMARWARLGRVAISLRGVAFQPCETSYVAARLVDAALAPPLARPLDVAGPQRLTFSAAVRAVAAQRTANPAAARHAPAGPGRRQALTVLSVPAIGGILRSLAAGSNLPPDDAVVGGWSFQEWLARR